MVSSERFTTSVSEPPLAIAPNTLGTSTEGVLDTGYDRLMLTPDEPSWEGIDVDSTTAKAYDRYLKIHKVFVGRSGASQLENVFEAMKAANAPRYLAAAGSAAAESALMGTDRPVDHRLALLDKGVEAWTRALQIQRGMNIVSPDCFKEYSYPYRLALDIAVAPLVGAMIKGDVDMDTCKSVYEDCLAVAQANGVQLALALQAGEHDAVAEHSGFGHECNLLLAFNRTMSPTWFAVPSMARCDTGYEYKKQTHDLVLIHQKWGKLKKAIPTEVKATVSQRDKARYDALLVRGKMHLCAEGKYTSGDTLALLTAAHDQIATPAEQVVVDRITERLTGMARRYRAGELLGHTAQRSVTTFHDSTIVAAHYPGLEKKAAA